MEVISRSSRGYRVCINVDTPIGSGPLKDYLLPCVLCYDASSTCRNYNRIATRWLLYPTLYTAITIYEDVKYIAIAKALRKEYL